ncbi:MULTISPECIES: cytochrome c maturation protein CcmE [unclassified Duganella]|jgi:cytochrome c-type biogenesis protein CcmE|uniref:cytochrome c maturation protein CcmE n=1 Tax=unclassified Duganella TaxID=2636909 RepID=UPI00088BAFE8|nr:MULTISPECIES: cytochrome c maturation protein CcmE [unclassified Duganella]SDH14184.1 cytochrome c-type biogenesis protein CcmE [Duganella sp. OV458]SDK28736.1 cytochrome c-type biogenesis protein CcmE [Duganella sp. OV510]
MKPRQKRLALVAAGLALLALAAWLISSAFQKNLVFSVTPTEVLASPDHARNLRMGGLVEKGSLRREGDGVTVDFFITDMVQRVPVRYSGILPDLFKEGKGAVVQGKLGADGVFTATEVLAKHDENYMPPDAARALKEAAEAKDKQ